MKRNNTIFILANRLMNYSWFRIFYAHVYKWINSVGLITLIQKRSGGESAGLWAYLQDNGQYESLYKKYECNFRGQFGNEKAYRIGILYDPDPVTNANIQQAGNILGIDIRLFEIKDVELFSKLKHHKCDGIIIRPSHKNILMRSIFNEMAHIVNNEINIPIDPTIRELDIYESKRSLASFLEINDIPHPKTRIFIDYDKAIHFLNYSRYPLIFKSNLGSSASGVEIIINRKQAFAIARKLFKGYYLQKWETEKRSKEWGYLLIQEYIQNIKEFRIIQIGNSWFGHQKWKKPEQEYLSGSGVILWTPPSTRLMNFCFEIGRKHGFTTMCYDIFEDQYGEYYVNELQTWYGSYNPSQMYIENVPGRYLRTNGQWLFEQGLYNTHGSWPLRIAEFIKRIEMKYISLDKK